VFAPSAGDYAGRVSESTAGKLLIARLRELRKKHSLTQERFSEISGVAYKYYQLIEIGRRIDLRLSTLEKLAKAYGIKVHELLAPGVPHTRVAHQAKAKQKLPPK
jgi:transcriptional regulator with XRE-family HTH domain